MEQIFRTNDPVTLSFAEHLLSEAGIQFFVADQHISGAEGNILLFPRRILVPSEQVVRARTVLQGAGLE